MRYASIVLDQPIDTFNIVKLVCLLSCPSQVIFQGLNYHTVGILDFANYPVNIFLTTCFTSQTEINANPLGAILPGVLFSHSCSICLVAAIL